MALPLRKEGILPLLQSVFLTLDQIHLSPMMSLGLKNTRIHTAIGTEEKVVEEMKISLLDDCGVVQNIKTQGSEGHIGPDKLKGVGW